MAVHPALDIRVDLVPDEEDHDCADRLPEPEGDRFDCRIDFRVQQEEKFDRNRQDDGRGNRVEEESEEVGDDAGRRQAELEHGEREYADVGPSLPETNGLSAPKGFRRTTDRTPGGKSAVRERGRGVWPRRTRRADGSPAARAFRTAAAVSR